MLGEGLDAATVGFRVGYESPSQFSREYTRCFGTPPARDVRQLRGAVIAHTWTRWREAACRVTTR